MPVWDFAHAWDEYESANFVHITKPPYSNVLKILPAKDEKFQIKILIFFIFLLKT